MKIISPFNEKQIKSLNEYQQYGYFHPFTCGNCGNTLIATQNNWTCPTENCTYTQNWAHDFMTDFSWKKHNPMNLINGPDKKPSCGD